MQPTTVLLIRPATFYWTRLRATLREWPDLQIVEDVQQPEPGLRLAEKEQPDLIFMASDQADVAPVPLARDLHAASPTSQIIMIGRLLEPEEHRQLANDLAGFLQWPCVTAERLRTVVEAVRDGEVWAASMGVVRVLCEPERRRWPRGEAYPVLTEKERATLRGLTRGWTEGQIAVAEGVSRRTIEDRIFVLKEKFEVPTLFMLGMVAQRLGFVP